MSQRILLSFLSHSLTHTLLASFPLAMSSLCIYRPLLIFILPLLGFLLRCQCLRLLIYDVVFLPNLMFLCHAPGQGAPWDHPAGEPQHQGGGGAQETCECCLVRDLARGADVERLLCHCFHRGCLNLICSPVCSPQNCFELYNPNHKGQVIKACKTEADGRVVEGNHVVYRISAPTPEEKEEWIKSIK